MINSNAPYSGLANIMNMRDRNPNTQLAYVPNGYLNSVPTAPNPYTGIPQVNSPIAMNEGGMPSMQYPMQEEAGQLADRGRYGDTTLVHMTPGEVQGLASLGKLTINPDTGLPEAFNLRSLLPIIGGIAGSFLLPGVGTALGASALGAGAIGAGLGTAAGGLLAGQSFGEAALGGIMSGAMSFGMGSLMAGASPGLTEGVGGTVASDMAAGTTGLGGDFAYATVSGEPLVSQATGSLGDISVESLGQLPPTNAPDMMKTYYNSSPFNTTVSPKLPTAYTIAGRPDPVPLSSEIAKPFAPPNSVPNSYFSKEAIKPGFIGRNFLGKETIPAGEITRSQFIDAGGIASDMTTMDFAKQKLSDPLTYAPLAVGAVTGAFDNYKYKEPEDRPPEDSGFGDYSLVGGEVRRPIATEEELRRRAVEGGSQNYFNPYTYVRNDAPNETSSIKRNVLDSDKFKNVAEGGIVGLQQGGMAIPQAPSAMSAMLAPPMQQQPMPMQQQPMPMQGMPMQGMGQPQPQGIQPLPDQSIEFKKNMDMEGQLQQQKSASDLQGQAALLGLIGGAGNYLQSQGMNYPTTTPSGTRPQAPAMNQGTQVNMGASGGFAEGGVINRAAGGPTRDALTELFINHAAGKPTRNALTEFKNNSNITPDLFEKTYGLLFKQMGIYDELDNLTSPTAAPVQSAGGAASMNQLLSRSAYSNNSSPTAAPVQSAGGASSMKQLLSNPAYSKELAMGGLLGYNEGGMPSQEQGYFEGQVVGKGDGQSDEVPFLCRWWRSRYGYALS
jgi:hypothetical protein